MASPKKSPCKYPATMFGLKKWYTKMFEQLGWMVLAKNHRYEDKIVAYKISLGRLKEKLECKIDTIKNEDKKEDLMIMLDKVKILIRHVKKIL